MSGPRAPRPARLGRRQALGLLAAGAVAAAGCTSGRQAKRPATEPLTGEGPIVFVMPRDTSAGAQRRQAVRRWNQEHPGQEAEYLDLPSAADLQRSELLATLQAGRPDYDVLGLDVVWTAEFARTGAILPLDEVVSELGAARFLPPPLRSARFEGRYWAVPLHSNAGLLYYRKDLVEPPNSWEQLAELAREASRRHGIAGYVTQLARYEGLTVNAAELIWAHGGDFVRDGRVVVDSPEAVRGLSFLADGIREGWIPQAARSYNEELSRLAFQEGNAAFMRNWPYAYDLLSAQDSPVRDKFDVVRLPGVSALGGVNVALSRFSQHRRTAVEFIRFLTSDATQRVTFEQGGFPATVAAVYDDRGVQARQHYTEELRASVLTARARPITPYYGQVTRVIQQHAYDALWRRVPPASALRALAEDLVVALQGR